MSFAKSFTEPGLGLRAAAAGMLLLALAAYGPAFQAGFIWDDDMYVTENPHLRTWEGLQRIWLEPRATPQYYPLVFTSFWLEYRLWGLSPAGYHVVNVLLHWAASLLLWRALGALGLERRWAAAAALVFLLHPVQVESVAWVTERKNVLSLLFYLASALAMIRWFGLDPEKNAADGRGGKYAAGLLFFAASLMSKTVTCTLPAALLLVLWWRRGRIRPAEVAALLPFFVLGVASGLHTVWLERTHVGAEGAEWGFGPVARSLIAGRVIWFYAGKIFFPRELMFNYPRWEIDPGSPLQYVPPLAVLAVVALLWRLQKRLGRGPLAAVLFFCGTLFPALGFFNVYPFRFAFVADHFQYHASIGLIVLGVMAFAALFRRAGERARRGIAAAGAGAILLLAWLTFNQSLVYSDLETLWRETLARNPSAWLAHTNLANLLARQGRFAESIPHHEAAIRLRPDPEVSHNNLADTLVKFNRIAEAERHFEEAIRINPAFALPYLNYGLLKEAQGKPEEAARLYEAALRAKPDYAEAHTRLGQILLDSGASEKAERHFRSALRIRADSQEARIGLGSALARRNELEEARAVLAEALQLEPRSALAHYNLGLILNRMKRREEAFKHFAEALASDPTLSEAHHQAGIYLAANGRLPEAESRFRDAVRFKPEFAEAHLNLGLVLGLQGRHEESVAHLAEAARIEPGSARVRLRLAQGYWLAGRRGEAQEELAHLERLDARAAAEFRGWTEKGGDAP